MNNLKVIILSFLFVFSQSVFSNTNAYISDSALIKTINSKIMSNPQLAKLQITVNSVKGNVSLSGEVYTDDNASTLIQLAQATKGVKGVDAGFVLIQNKIIPFADTSMTAKINGLYERDKLFRNKNEKIKVDTTSGYVILNGNAINQKEIDEAISLAYSVPGIQYIESKIKLIKP